MPTPQAAPPPAAGKPQEGTVQNVTPQYADVWFPVYGVDISTALEQQNPDSCPLGINVRGFEPSSLRARGGARSGISKYVLGEVPAGPHAIQMLNVVVDPQAVALGISFTDTPNPPPYIVDPSNLGRNVLGDGSLGWIQIGSDWGGSGYHTNKSYKRKHPVRRFAFIQSNATAYSPPSSVEVANNLLVGVTKGNLLVVAITTANNNDGTSAAAPTIVTDGSGNPFSQAAAVSASLTYTTGPFTYHQNTSIWYMIAAATGNLTLQMAFVDAASPNNTTLVFAQEFSGAASSPFRAASANDAGVFRGSNDISTASISSNVGDLVIGFFGQTPTGDNYLSALSPFTPDNNTPGGPGTNELLEYLLLATGSQAAIANVEINPPGGLNAGSTWGCCIAAFKPR